ncbi:hypothetical protein NECID01_0998 [Nematocida sp. AWRm77]|nr:hypothetical protein NECID01_0998 [Nematocida sp. AWRm77]
MDNRFGTLIRKTKRKCKDVPRPIDSAQPNSDKQVVKIFLTWVVIVLGMAGLSVAIIVLGVDLLREISEIMHGSRKIYASSGNPGEKRDVGVFILSIAKKHRICFDSLALTVLVIIFLLCMQYLCTKLSLFSQETLSDTIIKSINSYIKRQSQGSQGQKEYSPAELARHAPKAQKNIHTASQRASQKL